MDMAQKDNWSRSIEVEQEDVIGRNSREQMGMSFVLDGRRSCGVVGRVAWSQKKFYDRDHGSLNVEKRWHSAKKEWWEEGRLSS